MILVLRGSTQPSGLGRNGGGWGGEGRRDGAGKEEVYRGREEEGEKGGEKRGEERRGVEKGREEGKTDR